jgi:hypothetical protein
MISSGGWRLTSTGLKMDPNLVRYFHFARFGVPPVLSFFLLVLLWREDELYGLRGTMFCVWFLAAGALQAFAASPGWWATGLVAQALLAIVLILKRQIDRIY